MKGMEGKNLLETDQQLQKRKEENHLECSEDENSLECRGGALAGMA